jgi:glutathione S-transferase
MTGRGPLARRVMRALLPVAMVYPKRRYRINPADAEEGRRKVSLALDRIEAEVGPSGYLVGDGFTVADLAAAALLFPVAWPAELQYGYPGAAALGVVGVAHAPSRRRVDHEDVQPPSRRLGRS